MILTEAEVEELQKLMSTKCVIQPPDPFNYKPQCWKKWKRRFRRYLEALRNSLRSSESLDIDDNEAVKLLVHLLGENAEETFTIIERNSGWSLEAGLDETMERLNEHFRRMMGNNIYVRINFHRRMQTRGQTISDFIKAIKFLAGPCNFGDSYDVMMRDKMVIGINCDSTREKMFAFEDILTFETACAIAFNEELRASRRPG
ncbi:hypothetical protein O0L34_g14553 [Tuta absoluta]|nr:hypothetical protein O0L34_g14553 [Tuta absoluta]